MVQVGREAKTAAQGTANSACGSRGMSCDFAVLYAFGASAQKKFETSRMMPMLPWMLPSCRDGSHDLRYVSFTLSKH